MKVLIASDHAGYRYKAILFKEIEEQGYSVIDLGTYDESPTDYPDQASTIANALLNKEGERGIIMCGSGVGVSVAVNKFRGIRAGVCHDTYSAHQCVEHDNVNILCIGQRVIGIELAREIVFAFLSANFSNAPRHVKRLEKINAIENKNMKDL
ncbi:MAG: ribose 5-phosphate isomerase B [Chitinophagaceae bacterium]